MKTIDTTRLALQALQRYPLRTAMLLLAISIGVAAVVMLTAVGEGARRYVTGQFASLGTNLLIVLPGRAETSGTGIQGLLVGETARELTLQDTIAVGRSPRIAQVTPLVIGSGTASWGARERDITVLGTSAPMLQIQHWVMQSGRFLPEGDLDVASPVCVLGSVVADELFGTQVPVGRWLRIGDSRCRVIGLLAQQGLAGGFNIDETVILPIANAQQIFNTSSVFRILAEANSRDAIQNARRDIIQIIKTRHAGEEDVTVVTQDALVSTFDSIFGMITAGLAAIAAISLVVAGVLIMNVMLVAVSQRTGEIGLLKAVGARNRQIIALFLTEAACLSLFGAAAGIAIGSGGTWLLRLAFPILDFQAPAWASLSAVGVAILSGLVFGILPARRAAALDPVLALMQR
ncbi:MAG TPA: ABC transporter permease [Gammaproteobacteria bacterium]|nr:ABC transporter permease [Gammaproteobacteria bacterium]